MNQSVIITILQNGQQIKELKINSDIFLSIGRDPQCNITINEPNISRLHATLMVRDGEVFISDDESTNKTWIADQSLEPHQFYPITSETIVSLAKGTYSLRITPVVKPAHNLYGNVSESQIMRLLHAQGRIVVGRDPDCDIRLDSLQVSRKHAMIEKNGSEFYISDLKSKNSTFVNGQIIAPEKPFRISQTDRITIGPYDFILRSESPKEIGKVGFAITADKVKKVYSKGKIGLHQMSVKIPTQSFVALMGPSGCGKSTLLKGLIGANPFTEGSVYIHGIKLNGQNFNQLKRNIGYVPQEDIIHKELTVDKTMYYAAKLRLADDVSADEMKRKITEVLKVLNVDDPILRRTKVGELSGGQRKRISIAVELLNDPTILFLDEPTSPLDPETIGDFLSCVRNLTKGGVTVIMVTHKPSDLDYVDEVLFLSAGGHLTFYGEKSDFLSHFNKDNIIDVYSLLKNQEIGKIWGEKWKSNLPQSEILPKPEKLERRSDSFFRQLFWLSVRYFNIKWSDKGNMAMLMAQPFIIAGLISFIFNELQIGVLFLMAVSAVWFGVSNSSKEIVGEIPVYERERMFNLNILGYLLSKISVLSLIAFVQCAIFVGIIYFRYSGHVEVNLRGYFPFVLAMLFIAVSASLFGLLLSTIFNNTEKVMTAVPVALIPQLMLAGVISKLDNIYKEVLSFFTLGRWGTEILGRLQDDLSKAQEKIKEFNCKPLSKSDDEAGTREVPQSVIQLKQNCENLEDSPKNLPESALEVLTYYGESAKKLRDNGPDPITLFEGIGGNSMALTIINFLTFLAIIILLKSRDKLK